MVRRHRRNTNQLRQVLDESDQSSNASSRPRASVRNVTRNQPSTSGQSGQRQQNQQKQASKSTQPKRQASKSTQPEKQATAEQNRRKNKWPKNINEIHRLQHSTENLVPKAPFSRLLREVLQEFGEFRMQSTAIHAIQEAAEMYFVALFDDAYKLTLHRNRVTLNPSDVQLVLYIRGQNDPGTR